MSNDHPTSPVPRRGGAPPAQDAATLEVGDWRVTVRIGSLTGTAPVDVLVSSDDNYLSHGGGVSAALWEAAGPAFREDAALRKVMAGERPRVGEVVTTGAGALPAEHLLHAITVDFDRGRGLGEKDLEQLFRNVLDHAVDKGARSLSLPLIGTGVAGTSQQTALTVLARVLELTPAPWPVAVNLFVLDRACAEVARSALAAAAASRQRLLGAAGSGAAPLPALWSAVASQALQRLRDTEQGASPLRDAAERLLNGTARDRYSDARAVADLLTRGTSDVAPPFAHVGGGEGTRSARALHNLIRAAADKDEVAELVARLRSSGYRGRRDDHVLLEFCASQDPLHVLHELFTAAQLRRLLAKHTGRTAPAGESPDAVYRRALRALDFPVPPDLVDPPSLHAHVRALRADAAHSELPELRGQISRTCAELEVLLRMLLRFVCRDAFGTAAEAFLVERGRVGSATEVTRASMGKLLSHLRFVDKALEVDDGPRAERVREHLGGRRLLSPGADAIPALRNRWAHGTDHVAVEVHDARRAVGELCDLVEELLDHWMQGDWPVFPSLVVVEEITRDKFGRVRVMARRSDGVVEQLFTDDEVLTGSTYLARRLTNPMSVDPVLVPLGDAFDLGE